MLIADDEDTIRRGMTKYMQLHTDRFSKIYEAENGQEALDILLQYQPQVMLLDVQMPGKSGIEVLQEAKRARYSAAQSAWPRLRGFWARQ